MVIFTWALLFRLVCRVIINLKGGKICIFNHIYILQIVKVWSCLQNILTAQKRKCQTQKSLRLIQHVLLIRILCYVRSLQYTYIREKVWHSKIVGIFTSMTLISLFFWLREKFDSGGFCLKFDGWHCRWEMHVCYQHSHFVCLYVYVQMKDVNMKDTYVKELHRHDHV